MCSFHLKKTLLKSFVRILKIDVFLKILIRINIPDADPDHIGTIENGSETQEKMTERNNLKIS